MTSRALINEVDDLKRRVEALEAEAKRRRGGRPRKEEAGHAPDE